MAFQEIRSISKDGPSRQTIIEASASECTALLAEASSHHNDLSQSERAVDPSPRQLKQSRSILSILAVLLIGVFVSQADTSLVLATYGAIASEFNDLQNASWLLSSYMLAMCVGQPLVRLTPREVNVIEADLVQYGKLSDIFGRKPMLQLSYGLFATGSLLCGLCNSMPQLILARSIQGLGGGGMVCLVSIIITDLVPLRDIASYRSYVNVVQTVGRSSGGAIGGFLAQGVGWRWTLSGQTPLTLLAMVLVANSLDTPDKEDLSSRTSNKGIYQNLLRVDFLGALLMSTTILSFLLILDVGGEKVPWASTITYLLLAIGLSCGLLFTLVEARATEPIFPLSLLRSRNVLIPYVILTIQTASQSALMFSIPLYFQITRNATLGQAGASMVPSIVGNTVGGLMAGSMIKRYGRYKLGTVLAALSSILCFSLLLIFWHGNTSVAQSLFVFFGGFATGVSHSTVFVALAASVSQKDLAIASSGLYLSGSIGAVAGLCAVSAVFQSSLRFRLNEILVGEGIDHAQEIIRTALSDISYVQHLQGRIHDLVVSSYVSSFHASFILCVALASVCLVASLLLSEKRLN